MEEQLTERCPHCGASMKMYWQRLTPLLVKTLVKIRSAIIAKGENKIHPHNEMELSTTEHMNMTKLRFHALIAKCKEDGKAERGYWLLTKRGNEFLNGKIQLPDKVLTFRNKVVRHSESLVSISDVLKSEPYVDKVFDYELEEARK